ncbi:hypothetical protein ALC57_11629 [Trachymyrmex cornetzi]|uniref:Uncharacterized protein n=1 Tax=Trachymyrmex cornetzi TaxID=471704 RepID=A0A195DU87_9HYME|nr:hypothetical protein ALC57_11629 [Trachymyrmex cornetzi]
MADRVCSDVRYQFYSRTGILPKYRYDTYLFSSKFLEYSSSLAYPARLSSNNMSVTRTASYNPPVSRACGPLEWRLHFFKQLRASRVERLQESFGFRRREDVDIHGIRRGRNYLSGVYTVAGIFYVIRGRVVQARRGNADNSLLFRKPRSTEFGPSSPSVGAVEDTLDVGRGGFSSLKTALTFGSARHSANECRYPPPNNRPDLCIVWPEVLRVEWRDPSIEHPTGCGFRRLAESFMSTNTFRSTKILSLGRTVVGTVYVETRSSRKARECVLCTLNDGMINGRWAALCTHRLQLHLYRPAPYPYDTSSALPYILLELSRSGTAIRAACFPLSQPGQPTAVSTCRKYSYNGSLHKLGTPFLPSTLIFSFCTLCRLRLKGILMGLIRRNLTVFQRVRNSFDRRIRACIRAEGGHFEHFI